MLLKDPQGDEQKAYDFIDAFLEEDSGAFLVNDWGYGHSNADVMRKHGEAAGFLSLEAYSHNKLWQEPLNQGVAWSDGQGIRVDQNWFLIRGLTLEYGPKGDTCNKTFGPLDDMTAEIECQML